MSAARFEWKVGLFVFVGLVLLGGLLLQFSKGITFFEKTYELRLVTSNAGAIAPKAVVLMAGLPIGSVVRTEFSPGHRGVMIYLKIYAKYPVHTNAVFAIDQSGFLGDQFISVVPGSGKADSLANGAIVTCQPPFNLLEAARSGMGLLHGADSVIGTLEEMLAKIDRTVLTESNLTSLTNVFANLKPMSERARSIVSNVDLLVSTNSPWINLSMSNLALLSSNLNRLSARVQTTLDTQQPELATTLTNMAAATGRANDLLRGLQSGEGLAGSLFKNESLRQELSLTLSNLATLSSNLNRFGLLYKPKPVRTKTPPSGYLLPYR